MFIMYVDMNVYVDHLWLYVLLSSVCLRIQINPQNKRDFLTISPERAFADFLFAHTVLHLVVVNFVG
uniref:Dolichyl-diphosphooligosaccharide--protein glycosyltransferase subunit DAD1 n=1 Tax=Sinocyclocheilus anshuiensis TaxID=1608454 RepID=A0A671MTS7_9TELE